MVTTRSATRLARAQAVVLQQAETAHTSQPAVDAGDQMDLDGDIIMDAPAAAPPTGRRTRATKKRKTTKSSSASRRVAITTEPVEAAAHRRRTRKTVLPLPSTAITAQPSQQGVRVDDGEDVIMDDAAPVEEVVSPRLLASEAPTSVATNRASEEKAMEAAEGVLADTTPPVLTTVEGADVTRAPANNEHQTDDADQPAPAHPVAEPTVRRSSRTLSAPERYGSVLPAKKTVTTAVKAQAKVKGTASAKKTTHTTRSKGPATSEGQKPKIRSSRKAARAPRPVAKKQPKASMMPDPIVPPQTTTVDPEPSTSNVNAHALVTPVPPTQGGPASQAPSTAEANIGAERRSSTKASKRHNPYDKAKAVAKVAAKGKGKGKATDDAVTESNQVAAVEANGAAIGSSNASVITHDAADEDMEEAGNDDGIQERQAVNPDWWRGKNYGDMTGTEPLQLPRNVPVKQFRGYVEAHRPYWGENTDRNAEMTLDELHPDMLPEPEMLPDSPVQEVREAMAEGESDDGGPVRKVPEDGEAEKEGDEGEQREQAEQADAEQANAEQADTEQADTEQADTAQDPLDSNGIDEEVTAGSRPDNEAAPPTPTARADNILAQFENTAQPTNEATTSQATPPSPTTGAPVQVNTDPHPGARDISNDRLPLRSTLKPAQPDLTGRRATMRSRFEDEGN